MATTIGNISFLMGPHTLGAADNLEDAIIDFINGAEKRLEIAVQELDNWRIADALVAAKKRKITISIVTEGDYLKSYPGLKDPYQESGKLKPNREILAVLLRAGINLKIDFNTNIFHQKFIIRDRESVLTGSTNFTETGTHSNLNHIMIIHDKKVARVYYREFKEIMQGHFGKLNEGHDPVPLTCTVSDVPMKVLFAPDHNPEMEIMKQIAKARKRIDFAIFTFSQSSGIDDALMVSKRAGVEISGVFDAKQGNQSWASTRLVHAAGIETYLASNYKVPDLPHRLGKVHHKLMVIDEQVVIGGSFNYTGPANALNDENILIMGDYTDDESSNQYKAQKAIGGCALEEINRIIAQFGRKVV